MRGGSKPCTVLYIVNNAYENINAVLKLPVKLNLYQKVKHCCHSGGFV